MALYKLTHVDSVQRTTDKAYLSSKDPNYLAWLALGNTPDPADPLPTLFAGNFQLVGKVRTTDATTTEVFRTTLAPMTEYAGQATVVGIDAGDGTSKVVLASIAAKRLGAGALQIGAPVRLNPGQEDAASSSWIVNASVSGNDWLVTVQGATGRTIDWHLFGTVVSFAPGGLA
jgi:hypothetical protein